MSPTVSVLYYTSNQEPDPFATKVREDLLSKLGSFPLVSVSQMPLPGFGNNICVGQVGPSYPNLVRQLQFGLASITTDFTLVAEADTIYPPEYFKFIPPEIDSCYRYDNVWVIRKKNEFKRKRYVEGAQIIGTRYFKSLVDKALNRLPMWTAPRIQGVGLVHPKGHWKFFSGGNPVVIFKTGYGLRSVTGVIKDSPPVESLPYWGTAKGLRKRFYWTWPK